MGTKGREIVGLDVGRVVELLNKAFADEWLAYYQYWLGEALRQIVARLNNHSLALFEEMFDFTLHENIRDPALVNDAAAAWAARIGAFDLQVEAELFQWRGQVAQRIEPRRES